MHTNDTVELSPEELEEINGGFWDEICEFGKGVWDKTKNVVRRLKDWG